MAIWSRTLAEVKRSIAITVRSLRNKAELTAEEWLEIISSINEAIIDLSMERGLDLPKMMLDDDSESTTADTAYVDLDAGILAVTPGTVRITSEDRLLTEITLEEYMAYDVGEDASNNVPEHYAIDTDGSGSIRMRLRPVPDASYSITFKCERLPEEDAISSLSGEYHGALRSLATSIVLETFGLQGGDVHFRRYRERLKNLREKARGSVGPRHVGAAEHGVRSLAAEERATI